MVKNLLLDAIKHLDINLLKTAIVSGETHKIQNNDRPNTLNIAIRRILSIKHQQEL